jgi:hypothetical protein
MTQRLTDDRLQALRLMLQEHAASWLHTDAWYDIDRDTLAAMLDEIEERRRIDARRLDDAEQAFREECEAAAKLPGGWLKDAPFVIIDEHCKPMTKEEWAELLAALGELEREP